MNYPSAPWHLHGYGVQTLHLLDIEYARPFIPSNLKIIPILPGKTLGGVYVAYYGTDSVMEYNELIVVSGLVSHAGKIGSWISHIYVDNPDSVAGGREIWGLPKELAQFKWNFKEGPSVEVRQGDRQLCSVNCTWRSPSIPIPLSAPIFGMLNSKLLMFEGQGKFNLQVVGAKLDVPAESPFAELKLGQGWLAVYSDPLSLTAGVPEMVA